MVDEGLTRRESDGLEDVSRSHISDFLFKT